MGLFRRWIPYATALTRAFSLELLDLKGGYRGPMCRILYLPFPSTQL